MAAVLFRLAFGLPFVVLFLAFALAVGGAIGATTQFQLQRDLWVWPMPDLAHRFLAAAAAAYVAGGVYCLAVRKRGAAELLCVTVLLYGAPLVGAVVYDREVIDWGRPVAWAFVAIVAIAMAIAVAFVRDEIRHSRRNGWRTDTQGVFFAALALSAMLVGAFVFLAPKQAEWAWPWAELAAWKPLDSRLTASMLLTIGGGSAWLALRRRDGMARLFAAMLVAYALVSAVALRKHAQAAPAFESEDYVYAAAFLLIATGSVMVGALGKRER